MAMPLAFGPGFGAMPNLVKREEETYTPPPPPPPPPAAGETPIKATNLAGAISQMVHPPPGAAYPLPLPPIVPPIIILPLPPSFLSELSSEIRSLIQQGEIPIAVTPRGVIALKPPSTIINVPLPQPLPLPIPPQPQPTTQAAPGLEVALQHLRENLERREEATHGQTAPPGLEEAIQRLLEIQQLETQRLQRLRELGEETQREQVLQGMPHEEVTPPHVIIPLVTTQTVGRPPIPILIR